MTFRLASIVWLLLLMRAMAGDAAGDWQRIVELDAGPSARPSTQQEAKAAAAGHLAKQEKALRAFIAAYPADAHGFEARLRLARLLQIRAGMEGSEAPRHEARRLLDELNRTATREQRPEIDFALIAYEMRVMRPASPTDREHLLMSARRFQAEHPNDRRTGRLLAEVSTMFEAQPETKRSLLLSAQAAAQEEELKLRLADDLKRLDLLGKPLVLSFNTLSGKAIDVAGSRGKVVLLVCFADWSPPSMEAVTKLQRSVRELPKEKVDVFGLSLDNKEEELSANLSKYAITWPVGFDGKGWSSPAIRAMGINSLPTVWLIDQKGVLRSLNALEATNDQVMSLLRKGGAE